jgi:hypothetical protein
MTIILIILLAVLSGIAKAIADTSASCYPESKLTLFKNPYYWAKSVGSDSKYKNDDPKQGEKFFGSTTFLVWLTDAWHLFTFITDVTLLAAAALTGMSWWLIGVFALRQFTFELTYRFLKL